MDIRKAYESMVLDTTDFSVWAGSSANLSNARAQITRGEFPSDKLMRARLTKAGYKCVSKEMWRRKATQ